MDMPAFIGPGPGNPLGTRAMNLSASGIRIHGTPDAGSIGGPASHGCIRMLIHDAEELFDAVDVGTPVMIVGN
jgi:lipoprotein-anchoring transpeptidase ErfK/SrfK